MRKNALMNVDSSANSELRPLKSPRLAEPSRVVVGAGDGGQGAFVNNFY